MDEYKVQVPNNPSGGYKVGEVLFFAYYGKKPSWLHRFMTEKLLGWKWEDNLCK